jgi:NTP pyrophosphatase (non-canonical NTP hydrolase)
MSISELQRQVDEWIKTYGVNYFDEKTNMLILMEEVGELSRLMARVYGQQSFKNKEKERTAKEEIKDELADIVFVVTCLANQMGIDLEVAIQQNIQKKTDRDSERHLKNTKINPRT